METLFVFHTHILNKFIFRYQKKEEKSLVELHAENLRFLAEVFLTIRVGAHSRFDAYANKKNYDRSC